MNQEDCSRLWEAEALDDGRLTGSDRASFERHAATCTECRHELAALATLRAKLALVTPPAIAELDRHRLRATILRKANAHVFTPNRLQAWHLLFVPAAILGVALFVGLRERRRPVETPHPTEDQALAAPRSDGTGSSSAAPSQPETSGSTTTAGAKRSPRVEAASARGPVSLAPASAPPHEVHPRAGQLFDEGVASFSSGDYVRADQQLARFAQEFPSDRRTEDAAYLRAVARWRAGDRDVARQLARAYLDAYPNGLRQMEAQRLVDDAARP